MGTLIGWLRRDRDLEYAAIEHDGLSVAARTRSRGVRRPASTHADMEVLTRQESVRWRASPHGS